MPYTVGSLPTWLKNLPKGAIKIGVDTFNRVLEETGDEDQARKAAWRNIKLKYKKVGDEWVRRTEAAYSFNAAIHSIETGKEQNLATFYIMNTSPNRIGWGVTDKALTEALPTLIGKPISCASGYELGHSGSHIAAGKFIKVEKPNGHALGTTEITDPKVWELVSSGEWGPISVVINVYRVSCSLCGEDIEGDYMEHNHIAEGEAYAKVESFTFERVDFVDVPAFPQAETLQLEVLAEFYASQSIKDGAQGPQGNLKPEEERKKQMEELEQVKQELETLKAEHDTLKTEKTDLEAKLKAAEEAGTDPEKNPALKELKAKVEKMEADAHSKLVDAAVEARFKAGLATDKKVEAETLKIYDDATLSLLAGEAEKVAKMLEKDKPTGPKAKYTKDERTAFDASIEDARARLYGHRRRARAFNEGNPDKAIVLDKVYKSWP